MEAQQGELESFTSLDWVCNRRSTDDKAVSFDAVEFLELLELADERVFVLLSHLGAELEHHYCVSVRAQGWYD